jgi:transposase
LEARRAQAAKLFAAGAAQAEVARRLGVSRQSVSRWFAAWRAEGATGLAGAGRAGRAPRLDAAQRARLDAELRRGPAIRPSCGRWPGWPR